MSSLIPWRELMTFGFGTLRLSSQAFWSMTPREINAALEAHYGAAVAARRSDLERLMTLFPDFPPSDREERVP